MFPGIVPGSCSGTLRLQKFYFEFWNIWNLSQNERTSVTHLLDNINSDYASLQASMALVKSDVGTNGKMNNFEATSSFLLPNDPVLKNKTSNDCCFIAEVDGGIDDDKNQEDGTIRVV